MKNLLIIHFFHRLVLRPKIDKILLLSEIEADHVTIIHVFFSNTRYANPSPQALVYWGMSVWISQSFERIWMCPSTYHQTTQEWPKQIIFKSFLMPEAAELAVSTGVKFSAFLLRTKQYPHTQTDFQKVSPCFSQSLENLSQALMCGWWCFSFAIPLKPNTLQNQSDSLFETSTPDETSSEM